jgi:hypothetical protein
MPVWKSRYVYHMTEAPNWTSIQRLGLLSTSRLLDFAGVTGKERYGLERQQRVHSQCLPNGAVIRDQVPLPPAALLRCLAKGLEPADWYAELNRRVFFWLDPTRLNRQRHACGASPQVVLVIDAQRLLGRHQAEIALTPFNTGNARRRPARRGRETFVSYLEWQASGWSAEAQALGVRQRSPSHMPVELAMCDAVPDVLDFVADVHCLREHQYLNDQ